MNAQFAQKITAAAKLGAIGDALGLQVEAQRSWQIGERFSSGVDKLVSLSSVNIHPDYAATSESGVISDDTLFMLAMMDGLREASEWDGNTQLRQLIEKYDSDPIGFGKNTREAIAILRTGGAIPDHNPGAVGSGPVTRLFPLSAWLYATRKSDESRAYVVRDMTRQTHPNETTCAYSYIHDAVLCILMSETRNTRDIMDIFHTKNTIPNLKELFKDGRSPSDLEIRLAYGLDEGRINGINRAFAVWNILGASYAFFLRNPNSFQAVIDAASNGGDTDSMAYIVGIMVGLHAPGVAGSPEATALFDQIQRKNEIKTSVEEFVQAF